MSPCHHHHHHLHLHLHLQLHLHLLLFMENNTCSLFVLKEQKSGEESQPLHPIRTLGTFADPATSAMALRLPALACGPLRAVRAARVSGVTYGSSVV
jgi:hypothetical protein